MIISLDTFKTLEISLDIHINEVAPLNTFTVHELIKLSSLLNNFQTKHYGREKF